MLTIGELARRAGVPTSTVRYYERRGLVRPDAREGGQRRYAESTLRRLVFVRMFQEAGMPLDEVAVVLDAGSNQAWKAVARQRVDALGEEIARLTAARDALEGALLCRYDHPATECRVMGEEIDRRLGLSSVR